MISVKATILYLLASGVANCQCPDVSSIIAHDGTPVGNEEIIDGVNMYISRPSNSSQSVSTTALVYATDVYGIQRNENKLLVDSFARAGFLTVAPDLFNGTPAPSDLNDPTYNSTEFINAHGPEVVEPLLETAINYLRTTAGATKVGITGYCFGGRYSFRMVNASRAVRADVAFAAHPSRLEDVETAAIGFPVSVACAETDSLLTPEQRADMEGILANTSIPYQVSLYSGTNHGFGVRANVSDLQQRFGKETAFLQAVRWFQVMGLVSDSSSSSGGDTTTATNDTTGSGTNVTTSSAADSLPTTMTLWFLWTMAPAVLTVLLSV